MAKRGGKPNRGKRRVPKPNPLDVQTDSFIGAQVKPYQGLLGTQKKLATAETAANDRLSQGEQIALGNIQDSLTRSYGSLAGHIQQARDASVQNLAGQADFLKSVLGGDFAGTGADIADTSNAAQNAQDFSSSNLAGQSALADLGRSRVAAQMMNTEANREAGLRWDSRRNTVNQGIGAIRASRPFVRRQLQSQNLDDQISRMSAALAQQQFKAGEKWKQKEFDEGVRQFDDTLDYKNAQDAADAADGAASDAAKLAEKLQKEMRSAIGGAYKRLFKVDWVYDKDGNPTGQRQTYAPKAPLSTSFNELLNSLSSYEGGADVAAWNAAKWAADNPATWGTGKFAGQRQAKARKIYSMFKKQGVSGSVISQIMGQNYGDDWQSLVKRPRSKPISGRF